MKALAWVGLQVRSGVEVALCWIGARIQRHPGLFMFGAVAGVVLGSLAAA